MTKPRQTQKEQKLPPGVLNSELPLQEISENTLLEKYAKFDEKKAPASEAIDLIRLRVANGLAMAEDEPKKWIDSFFDAQVSGFVLAGRVNSAAGTGIKATLINCFVQPVGDSISQQCGDLPGIYPALQQATETMRRGGGVGYNFSNIRPRGAKVEGTGSHASGPISFMHVFDRSCETVESAGARRGAQMGILAVHHPDIRQFIVEKSKSGSLEQFNVSVGITDEFLDALKNGTPFELVHKAEPSREYYNDNVHQRDDGLWVYELVDPREIWDLIMQNTYNYSEPGILFLDRINQENSLAYAEYIDACNPCAEQPLPNYGCCCLGSINLAKFVLDPFSADKSPHENFDWEGFCLTVHRGVRMLDNVLDVTLWPLPEQEAEAQSKRRIGLGITGLGSALVMLKLRYDSDEGREFAEYIAEVTCYEAYRASVGLAKEKNPFPLFDKDKYLASPFIQRLPGDIQKDIEKYGIRNSHVLSIAPTGTISLAFCDNVSNGIEPSFSWTYTRNKRASDGNMQQFRVMDHAYRLFRTMYGEDEKLPEYFVHALEISPEDHLAMVSVFAPYIDSSISKTINCPEDMSFNAFKDIYTKAHRLGLKGVTTYRPSEVRGAILEVESKDKPAPKASADRKIRVVDVPRPALASLRWPKRPACPDGNASMTYMVNGVNSPFAVFIGHIENGSPHPFEIWVNGEEQPRGLGALAKSLSTDMRSEDRGWLKRKLDILAKSPGQAISLKLPGQEQSKVVASEAAALACLVRHRCQQLGAFEDIEQTPLINAMFSLDEPKSGTDGTLSWTVDVNNTATGDNFSVFLKEAELPDGTHRPYSVKLSGDYPSTFNALCLSLSMDMRVIDPAWIGKKLRSLSRFPEPRGDFFAKMPGQSKAVNQPSSIAYVARLIIHRYHMLGILNEQGVPVTEMGLFTQDTDAGNERLDNHTSISGRKCPECSVNALIRKDNCDFCTACGYVGSCG